MIIPTKIGRLNVAKVTGRPQEKYTLIIYLTSIIIIIMAGVKNVKASKYRVVLCFPSFFFMRKLKKVKSFFDPFRPLTFTHLF